jgi:hypothetical protein
MKPSALRRCYFLCGAGHRFIEIVPNDRFAAMDMKRLIYCNAYRLMFYVFSTVGCKNAFASNASAQATLKILLISKSCRLIPFNIVSKFLFGQESFSTNPWLHRSLTRRKIHPNDY